MFQEKPQPRTRRFVLKTGTAAMALSAAGTFVRPAIAQTRPVSKVLDFTTSADVAKAEQEGALLFYTQDGEAGAQEVIDAFNKDFPKIKAAYFRLQSGALYSRILAERSAGRFDVDVIQFSDVTTAIDFDKRGGYDTYDSPETAEYDPRYRSNPPGRYFCSGVSFAGIAYNTDKVAAADAPKSWKDLLDPRWANVTSTKQSTSGMQFVAWYELRKLYGNDYWKAFAKQRPHGFDSRAQLFDRLAKGDDKICALAEYAGYVLYHQRKAPIAFVAPQDGLPAASLAAGVMNKAPHPEAARLFIDWMASLRGQTVYQNAPDLLYGSVRKDAPPMPGGLRLSDFKLLVPTDINDLMASHKAFNTDWNAMLGLL
jgi:iron(III) transport system substrate-binding protein